MRLLVMYLVLTYIIACADAVPDYNDPHPLPHRILRAIFWPVTLTSLFRTQGLRLYRLLNILWALLIGGWLMSLLADKL